LYTLIAAIDSYSERGFNHDFPGFLSHQSELESSQFNPDESFTVLSKDIIIGHGAADFKKANNLLFQFQMINKLPWISIRHFLNKEGLAIQPGQNIGILVHVYKLFWVLNPGRITCVSRNVRVGRGSESTTLSEVAFSTLTGHLLAGEERFRVLQSRDGIIRFEVLSFSRGAGLLGRLLLPLMRPLQHQFLRDVTQCMRRLICNQIP